MNWEIKDDILYVDKRKNLIKEKYLRGDYFILLIKGYKFFKPNVDMFESLFFELREDLYKGNTFLSLYKSGYNLLTEVAIMQSSKLFYGEECKNLIESNVILNKLME